MNKIKFTANKDTNYIFHMLSVAKCGYDNAYGEYYRPRYLEKDLMVLKSNEKLLTVSGGEHCGALYAVMVSEPACAEVSAKEYYCSIIDFEKKVINGSAPDITDPIKIQYAERIISIAEIMVKYYDDYVQNIWQDEKNKIENYIAQLQIAFENAQFTDKAEKWLGCQLPNELFMVTFVTSVEGGAEAIDISQSQDVFGIERGFEDAFYFIGHEFIIYLLMNVLADENAFKTFDTWEATEGLAEYYLKKIMGNIRFKEHRKYVEYYENCEKKVPPSPVELYRQALKDAAILEHNERGFA